MNQNPRDINLIVVHHSASNPATTNTATLRGWHTNPKKMRDGTWRYMGMRYPKSMPLPHKVRGKRGNGWADIGYHRIIEADGTVMDGRPVQRVGAHAPPNRLRLGICVVGFNGSDEHPDWEWSTVQWANLFDELDYWCRRIPKARVCGHRQTKATLCPGLDLPSELEQRRFGYMNRVIKGNIYGNV